MNLLNPNKEPTMKSPLQTLIEQCLKIAEANPGKWQTFRTTNNLKVDIQIHGTSTSLRISRSSHYPSLQDWSTISRHWPYPLNVTPKQAKAYGRNYLQAQWLPASEKTPVFAIPP
jgi:hypothetical protein